MLDDLGEFSVHKIELAIKAYRRDPENLFFPKPGQLRGLIVGTVDREFPACRLPTFKADHQPEPSRRAVKSVAEVLRDGGFPVAADQWEKWKEDRPQPD